MKRFFTKMLAVIMAAMLLITGLPMQSLAAVSRLAGNSTLENAALLEALRAAYGEDAETYLALLEKYGLLDENGQLITDEKVVVDGQEYTLEELEAYLDDPETDLSQVATVDGQAVTLETLKLMVEIERYLAYVKATYFTEQELSQEQIDSFYSLAENWAKGNLALRFSNPYSGVGPAGVDHGVTLTVKAEPTFKLEPSEIAAAGQYTFTVTASKATDTAKKTAITFDWRVYSGNLGVFQTGNSNNNPSAPTPVTLQPGETQSFAVTVMDSTWNRDSTPESARIPRMEGEASFLIQIYNVKNATIGGKTNWEQSVSVSCTDTFKYKGETVENIDYEGRYSYSNFWADTNSNDEFQSKDEEIFSQYHNNKTVNKVHSKQISVPDLDAGDYEAVVKVSGYLYPRDIVIQPQKGKYASFFGWKMYDTPDEAKNNLYWYIKNGWDEISSVQTDFPDGYDKSQDWWQTANVFTNNEVANQFNNTGGYPLSIAYNVTVESETESETFAGANTTKTFANSTAGGTSIWRDFVVPFFSTSDTTTERSATLTGK